MKRVVSFLLAAVLLLSAIPAVEIPANAATTYYINGKSVSLSDYSNSKSGDCWNYAQNIYTYLWSGSKFTNSFSASNNMLRERSDNELLLTPENLKAYVSQASLGAVIRICNSPNLHSHDGYVESNVKPGHSQIIVQKDSDGFTVLEGGLSDYPYCREHYYTWSDFCDSTWPGNYQYIKYIKWPNAPAYQPVYQEGYLAKCKAYGTYCNIKITDSAASLRNLPCNTNTDSSSKILETVSKGKILTATGVYRNTKNNLWYKVQTSSGTTAYVYSDGTEVVSFLNNASISGISAPTELIKGKSFSIKGNISTRYCNMAGVGAWVTQGTGTDAVTGIKEKSVSTKSYSLQSSEVDKAVKFGSLAAGSYTYHIGVKVQYYYASTNTVLASKCDTYQLYTKTFRVVTQATCSHSYGSKVTSATCTAQGYTTYTCSKCGYSYKDNYTSAKGHSYGSWVTQKAATCTASGTQKRTCTRCSSYETKTIAATGHSYTASTKSPTCTAQGYTTHTCSKCGNSYKDSYTSAKGHSYGSWVTVNQATCTSSGSKKRYCSRCNASETGTIAQKAHRHYLHIGKPTDTSSGVLLNLCYDCNTKEQLAVLPVLSEEDYVVQTVKKPTYTQKGSARYTLKNSRYDVSFDAAVPALKMGKVTGVKAVSASATSVKISWKKVPGATKYAVYQYANGKYTRIKNTTATSFTHTGLTLNKSYTYVVKAYTNESGKNIYGATSAKATAKTVLPKVTGVKATSAGATSIKLTWSKVTGATRYLHFTMEDNPALDEAIRRRYEALYTGAFYRRYILGQWCAAEGLIYDFSRERHITKDIPTQGRYFISVDYGTQNPFSAGLWCVTPGRAVRIKEYYYDGRKAGRCLTDEQYYDALCALAGDKPVEQVVVDPSAASFIAVLRRRGRFPVRKAKNDVLPGIRLVSSLLAKDVLLFTEQCTDSIREFSLYCWQPEGQDRPLKENDHAMDDIRYFCATVLRRDKSFQERFRDGNEEMADR